MFKGLLLLFFLKEEYSMETTLLTKPEILTLYKKGRQPSGSLEFSLNWGSQHKLVLKN